MKRIIAILMTLILAASLAACGGQETTLTGMVVSVDGTVISFVEMDENALDGMNFSEGERPEMPEGMGDFENFDPESFSGTMPEGENFPQWGQGEMPERPEGSTMPEGMEFPEGMTMPENGEQPDFDGGDRQPGFGNFPQGMEDMETTEVDIANAHISVEIENGKESGSLENIVPGVFVTITMSPKGEATYVLVSSQSFAGGRSPAN